MAKDYIVKFDFDTLKEAQAFADGVNYVNDSHCTVRRIVQNPVAALGWIVEVEDLDETGETSGEP